MAKNFFGFDRQEDEPKLDKELESSKMRQSPRRRFRAPEDPSIDKVIPGQVKSPYQVRRSE